MHYLTFGIIALIFFVMSYLVGAKKMIYLISTVDKGDIEKIENKDKVCKRFGIYYFILALVSIMCAFLTESYGLWGLGAGTILLMTLFVISVIMALKLYWFK